jgi:hypothetical protein
MAARSPVEGSGTDVVATDQYPSPAVPVVPLTHPPGTAALNEELLKSTISEPVESRISVLDDVTTPVELIGYENGAKSAMAGAENPGVMNENDNMSAYVIAAVVNAALATSIDPLTVCPSVSFHV